MELTEHHRQCYRLYRVYYLNEDEVLLIYCVVSSIGGATDECPPDKKKIFLKQNKDCQLAMLPYVGNEQKSFLLVPPVVLRTTQ